MNDTSKRIAIRAATHSGGFKSISDDDLCSDCQHCAYNPGGMSACNRDWPGMEDADGYVIECGSYQKASTAPSLNVAARRALRELLNRSRPEGNFAKGMEARKTAHLVYLSLFDEEERARVLAAAKEHAARMGWPFAFVDTFEAAAQAFGVSLIDEVLGADA
jgi:hypothetical protein